MWTTNKGNEKKYPLTGCDADAASPRDAFLEYLIVYAYKKPVCNGQPRIEQTYMEMIDFIAKEENTDWAGLAANVDTLLEEYGRDGAKAELGASLHYSVISALKRFSEFIKAGNNK